MKTFFFTSVMVHNNNVVCMWKQLIELSTAQVMPGIRPQIHMSWRVDVEDAEQKQNLDKGERGFNHFIPWL